MFVKYKYKASSTLANVIADVEKLITGETNLLNLSSDCDTANSAIYVNTVAKWILHDSAAGTNKRAYKALRSDSSTVYTYITIDYNTANSIIIDLHESWNATTHTGTNTTTPSATATDRQQRLSLTVGGNLYIGAGGKTINDTDYLYLIGEYSGTYGNNNSVLSGNLVSNFARRMTWDTDAAGAPTTINCIPGKTGAASIAFIPRYTTIGNTSLTAVALAFQGEVPANSTAAMPAIVPTLRQATTNNYFWVKPLATSAVNGFCTGLIIPNIYVFSATANMGDEIIGPDGLTYWIEVSGGGKTLIPRY